jgi:hypothetical protein
VHAVVVNRTAVNRTAGEAALIRRAAALIRRC